MLSSSVSSVLSLSGADTFDVTFDVTRGVTRGVTRDVSRGDASEGRIIGWGGDVIIANVSSSLEESAESGVPPTSR